MTVGAATRRRRDGHSLRGGASRRLADLARALPRGQSLPDDTWLQRHRALTAVAWAHAAGLPLFGIARGFGVAHTLAEAAVVAALALAATLAPRVTKRRLLAEAPVAIALLTSSALVVHLSGGTIEAHFHFFVMMAVLLLYEDWLPYLLAFGYVAVHHGLMGTIAPETVYNHPSAQEHPWRWAAIHAVFISAAGAANVVAWRLNEDVRAASRRAYERARASEERFRSAFANAPIGVALVDPVGTYIEVNRALCQALGYAHDELVGKSWRDITHPGDTAGMEDALSRLADARDATSHFEARLFRRDGAVVPTFVTMSLVADAAGRPIHLVSQVEDLTHRKQAEEELTKGHIRLGEVESLTGVGSWEWSLATGEFRWSDELYTILGHTPRSVQPTYELFVEAVHPDDRARVEGDVRRAVDTAASYRSEFRVVRPDGSPRTLSISAKVVRDAAGSPVQMIGAAQDVTDVREAEQERERLLAATREQNERLVELDRMKDDFVAAVSHELRTPLTSIRGYLELALNAAPGTSAAEQRHYLEVVDRNADRLLRLVGDLLFVAQVDAGSLALERGDVDLGRIVADSVQSAAPLAEAKGIELVTEGDDHAPLHGDASRLAQLVDNLVSNAIKFTPDGGRVTVRVERAGRRAVLEVTDTGIGIAPEEQGQLFQRFFRTRAASDRAIQGTGLGLAIAKAIAEAHAGSISVTSEPGCGTSFRVELPRAAAVTREAA